MIRYWTPTNYTKLFILDACPKSSQGQFQTGFLRVHRMPIVGHVILRWAEDYEMKIQARQAR